MKTRIKRRFKTQSVFDLPLFAWRIAAARPNTRAGSFLARRYHVRPAVADLIANLAGIGPRVEQ
ncbi:hypothetical protein [Bradyrhizobium sp. 2S1]|uniref:hypothetical protein n=1 Tax=Bradyrhizobium sp. 2S1 TaxID=1404429 RepID=UPI00140E67ED|nr:hypothetical protein [Bradyrhizobium sp. 2S1]MCK7665235.1 hypothetical protein [Bradyrhizobium sp. 2S1]